ncbi:4'-phosphopantetheinyl transferase family protein [Methylobacterium nonmethylotrophicum]|uniref:4'-phosphopantetheinyl transferase superfamily protein n=1 Tax=Methylobacterium nonmethylotrophicum TaxID=1141884 RepID=A0A4Z0NI68_9HYPH|nr:4'-phosphopantetheinyl transferase superfamily protein [Methylobacterium nonmethylotrophicum]TGD95417.1 4'-phosphopantetheinyl transferase superfamily protein [Methylobacterium nonmethylotrophicum]
MAVNLSDLVYGGGALAVAVPAAAVAQVPAERRALPADETARIARFRQEHDRLEREAAHGLLRVLLAPWLGSAPGTIVLARDGCGRPFLHGMPDLDLNLSHGGGWVAVGLSTCGRIGVDVEGAARPVDWDRIAPVFLHPAELAEYRALPADARPRRALELWSVKEACLKATGEGLVAEPSTVRLGPDGAAWRLARAGLSLRAASRVLADGARFAWAVEDEVEVSVVTAG